MVLLCLHCGIILLGGRGGWHTVRGHGVEHEKAITLDLAVSLAVATRRACLHRPKQVVVAGLAALEVVFKVYICVIAQL